jgi:3-deoxy-manno-octulosonate cytidylyltransferase (CMP-KDO synthetase)
MISESLAPMIENELINVVNLGARISSEEEFRDPNCIKVVCDDHGDAIYFSRLPIPYGTFLDDAPKTKQVCIIPFRRDFLLEYTRMVPTPLEVVESIDMLRIIENGLKVRIAPTSYETHAVDTPEDLQRVSLLMQKCKLVF